MLGKCSVGPQPVFEHNEVKVHSQCLDNALVSSGTMSVALALSKHFRVGKAKPYS